MHIPTFRALNEDQSDSDEEDSSSQSESTSENESKSSDSGGENSVESSDEELTPEAAEAMMQKQFQVALRCLVNDEIEGAKTQLQDLLMTPLFFENHGSPSLINLRYSCFKNLGDIHRTLKQSSEAVDCFLKASRIDATDITLWINLAEESAKCNNYLLARYALERGLETDSENWKCLDKLISVLFIVADFASCLFFIRQALDRDIEYLKGHILRDEIFKLSPFLEEKSQADLFKGVICLEYSKEQSDTVLKRLKPLIAKFRSHDDVPQQIEGQKPTVELKDYSWESLGEALLDQYKLLLQSNDDFALSRSLILTEWIKQESDVQVPVTQPEPDEKMEVEPISDWATTTAVLPSILNSPAVAKTDSALSTPTKTDQSSATESETDTNNPTTQSSADESENCSIVTTEEVFQHMGGAMKKQKAPMRGKKKASNRSRKWDHASSVYKRRSSRLVPGFQMEDNYLRVRKAALSERIRECLPKTLKMDSGNSIMDSPIRPKNYKDKASDGSFGKEYANLEKLVACKEEIDEFLKSNADNCICTAILAYLDALRGKYQTHLWSERQKGIFVDLVEAWNRHEQLYTPFNEDVSLDFLKKTSFIRLVFLELVTFWSKKSLDVSKQRLMSHTWLLANFQREFGKEWLDFGARVEWLKANELRGEMRQMALADCKEYVEVLERGLVLPNIQLTLSVSVVEKKEEQIEKATLLKQVNDVFHDGHFSKVVEILLCTLVEGEPLSELKELENRFEQTILLCKSLEAMKDFQNLAIWLTEPFECVIGRLKVVDVSERSKWMGRLKDIIRMLKMCLKEDRGSVLVHSRRLADILVRCIVLQHEWKSWLKATGNGQLKDPWILLYEIAKQAELDSLTEEYLKTWVKMADSLTVLLALRSLMLLRLAHEELGSNRLCTDGEGEFLLYFIEELKETLKNPLVAKFITSGCKDDMLNEAEQCFFCLYQYPNKKKRHLEDHYVKQIELTWDRAAVLFDFLRPEDTPEFDGKRTDSVSVDTVHMLQRIEGLVPEGLKPDSLLEKLEQYLSGQDEEFWMGLGNEEPIISLLYYLMGDYYQKNSDFPMAVRYYSLDLCVWPERFDAWGGLALARMGILQHSLQSVEMCISRQTQGVIKIQARKALKCFERAIEIQPDHLVLRTECGGLLYEVQGFFSRLKNKNEIKIVRNEAMENQKVFLNQAQQIYSSLLEEEPFYDEAKRERWFQHFMYGKTLEKQGWSPAKVLPQYHRAAHCLFVEGAKYKEKIKYEYCSNFELESLEIHYRVHASILKWIEKGQFLDQIPLMRRYVKIFREHGVCRQEYSKKPELKKQRLKALPEVTECLEDVLDFVSGEMIVNKGDGGNDKNAVGYVVRDLTERVWMQEEIVSKCCDAMRLCIKRFFNHYKAYHRLAMAYLKLPSVKSIEKAKLVLLGPVQNLKKNERLAMSLFQNRKNNNLFEGIYRIPQDDIDRNGSFNAHMLRAVELTLTVLNAGRHWRTILEICYQLARKPDKEKQVLTNVDRLMICQRATDSAFRFVKSALEETSKRKSMHTMLVLLRECNRAYSTLSRQKDTKIDTSNWKAFLAGQLTKITGKKLDDAVSEAMVISSIDNLVAKLEREQVTINHPTVGPVRHPVNTTWSSSHVQHRKRSMGRTTGGVQDLSGDSIFSPPAPKRMISTAGSPATSKPPQSVDDMLKDRHFRILLELQRAYIRGGATIAQMEDELMRSAQTPEQRQILLAFINSQRPVASGSSAIHGTLPVHTSGNISKPVSLENVKEKTKYHPSLYRRDMKLGKGSNSVGTSAQFIQQAGPASKTAGSPSNRLSGVASQKAKLLSYQHCRKTAHKLPSVSYLGNSEAPINLSSSNRSCPDPFDPSFSASGTGLTAGKAQQKPTLYRPYDVPEKKHAEHSQRASTWISGGVLPPATEKARKTINRGLHGHLGPKKAAGTEKSPIRID